MDDSHRSDERPDWVMVGVPALDGGVILFASRTLTEVELRHKSTLASRSERASWFESQVTFPLVERRWCEVEAKMDDYVMICGATYAECLAGLMRHWQPDQAWSGPAAQVGDGRRELGP